MPEPDGETVVQAPLPAKLRLFLIDERTGGPARRIAIEASAHMFPGQDPVSTQVPATVAAHTVILGLLVSDHAGYLSFDLSRVAGSLATHLWIAPCSQPDRRVDLLAVIAWQWLWFRTVRVSMGSRSA